MGDIIAKARLPISKATARNWVKKHDQLGPQAVRRTRKQSQQLGRKRIVTVQQLEPILEPSHPLLCGFLGRFGRSIDSSTGSL